MTELEKLFYEARNEWRKDAHLKDSEPIYKGEHGEYILVDGYKVLMPYELSNLEAFKVMRFE